MNFKQTVEFNIIIKLKRETYPMDINFEERSLSTLKEEKHINFERREAYQL